MSNVSFSLTKQVIVHHVLHLRALLEIPATAEKGKKMRHFVESEIQARCVAAFTSVFAAADSFVHAVSGIYKGAHLLLGRCCNLRPAAWNKAEVYEHFRRAAFFAGVVLVGSVAGAISPGVVKHFKLPAFSSFDESHLNTFPEVVRNLANSVQSNEELPPFERLKNFWHKSSLQAKHWFVQAFNLDSEKFQTVRQTLADTVYRPIVATPLAKRQLQWLNEKDVSSQLGSTAEKTDAFSKGFFFHATSEKALESILTSKKVEVRHEKAFRGAFVSTRPELGFGNCVLVFKRNIERLSSLQHGFLIDQKTYWAGFSQDIPVTDNSLAYILLNSDSDEERKSLEQRCQTWAGKKIEVVLIKDAKQKLQQVEHLGMGIPKEWPDEGESKGRQILHAMKLAVAVPQPVKVQYRQPVFA